MTTREVTLQLPHLSGPLVRGFEDWANRSGMKLQINRRNGRFIMKVICPDIEVKMIIKEIKK